MELERGNHIANNKLYKRKRRHIRHHMITKHRKKEEESFTQTETNSRKKGRFLIAEAITLNTKTIEVLLHTFRERCRARASHILLHFQRDNGVFMPSSPAH